MKKFMLFLGIFIGLIFGAFLFLESSMGAQTVQYFLVRSLKKSGVPIQIGKMEGSFSKKIRIERLQAGPINADWVEFRPSLASLLRGKICIETLEAEGIRFDPLKVSPNGFHIPLTLTIHSFSLKRIDAFIDFNAHGKITLYRSGGGKGRVWFFKTDCPDFVLETRGSWSQTGVVDLAFQAQTQDIHCIAPALSGAFASKGTLKGSIAHWRGAIDGKLAPSAASESTLNPSIRFASNLKGSYKNITFENLELFTPFADAIATLSVKPEQNQTQLSVQLHSLKSPYGIEQGDFEGNYAEGALFGNLSLLGVYRGEGWTFQSPLSYKIKETLALSQIELRSSSVNAFGHLNLLPNRLWTGSLSWDKGNLSLLSYNGTSHGTVNFSVEEEEQAVELDATAEEIYALDAYAAHGKIQAKYLSKKGTVQAELKNLLWQEVILDQGSIRFEWDECTPTPFCLYAEGAMRGPFEIEAGGEWDLSSRLARFEWMQGTVFGLPLKLQEETVLQLNSERGAIEHLNLTLANAQIAVDYLGTEEDSHAKIAITNLPLDLLSPTRSTGTLSFQGEIKNSKGEFSLSIPAGKAKGKILPNRIFVQMDGLTKGNLQIPIELTLWPLNFEILWNGPIAGQFQYKGKVEDLLDPFDFGSHHIEGQCMADFELSGKFSHPQVQGFFRLENGGYQNYWSGTELTQVQLNLEAHGDQIAIRTFTGVNPTGQGSIKGKGSLLLNANQEFPYQIDLQLNHLELSEIDLVRLQATGPAEFSGTWKRGQIKGALNLDLCSIHIPERIRKSLPNLQVVYKNQAGTQNNLPAAPKTPSYLLALAFDLDAPKVTINGRGLNSEWNGKFFIGGTTNNPTAQGKIELTKGEFTFSSRSFQLTEGTVLMDGLTDHMPQLNIAGKSDEQGISIIVRLHGPLNEPQITFQSNPPLPFNNILSYLLFGRDISEITAFQALQLVNSAATISGGSPDILETTRKSLGIDRLRIVSRPSLGDGEDSIALQVGQYVAEGIIISVTQGPEQSSTNISIEVDLSRGFVFQAETIQEEEQGKFTIKWSRNY